MLRAVFAFYGLDFVLVWWMWLFIVLNAINSVGMVISLMMNVQV